MSSINFQGAAQQYEDELQFTRLMSALAHGLVDRAMEELRAELECRVMQELHEMEPKIRRVFSHDRCADTVQLILHPKEKKP